MSFFTIMNINRNIVIENGPERTMKAKTFLKN